MTGTEALSSITALVGAGGFTSMVVAFLAYKSAAAKGRPEPDGEAPAIALGCALSQRGELEALTQALTGLSMLMARQIELAERRFKADEDRERDHDAEELAELRIMARQLRQQSPGVELTPRRRE